MKKIILMTLLCVLTIGSYAQRVYKEGNSFIIECKGMPATSYTKLAKPSTLTATVNGITGINSAAANQTVAYKFEVQIRNQNDASTRDDAIQSCSWRGPGWRLPTQRELQLIWTMREALEKLDNFAPFDKKDYWSATDCFSGYGIAVFFNTGYTSMRNSSYTSPMRCIREIIE